jgi:hypothetical protein
MIIFKTQNEEEEKISFRTTLWGLNIKSEVSLAQKNFKPPKRCLTWAPEVTGAQVTQTKESLCI